jgi:hypothetical protein
MASSSEKVDNLVIDNCSKDILDKVPSSELLEAPWYVGQQSEIDLLPK